MLVTVSGGHCRAGDRFCARGPAQRPENPVPRLAALPTLNPALAWENSGQLLASLAARAWPRDLPPPIPRRLRV